MKLNLLGSIIEVEGNIKTISDIESLLSNIESIIRINKNVTLRLKDAIVLPSAVIGYLSRLVMEEGVYVSIECKEDTLYELLSDLDLINVFHVKKIK